MSVSRRAESANVVAVTGATGFVGRHVVRALQGRHVGIVAGVRRGSAGTLPQGVRGVEIDLASTPAGGFEALGSPDTLIHLAWSGLPNYRSAHHLESELPAQVRFLESLVQQGLRTLVVSGTCYEYGLQSGMLDESREPQPITPYASAKDALRRHLMELQQRTRFNLVWARLFFMYGDGQAQSSLLPQLRQAVERGDRQFNMSGGAQLRDYLPIERVAEYLAQLALLRRDVGVVNVCSGAPISVRDLVAGWIRENGWQIDMNLGFYPYSDYEPMEFWGDPSKLRSLIDA